MMVMNREFLVRTKEIEAYSRREAKRIAEMLFPGAEHIIIYGERRPKWLIKLSEAERRKRGITLHYFIVAKYLK